MTNLTLQAGEFRQERGGRLGGAALTAVGRYRPRLAWLWLTPWLLTAACSFRPSPVLLPAVGPAPGADAAVGAGAEGLLAVYSAWDPLSARYVEDHTPYTIMTSDGKPLQQVTNHKYLDDFYPARVALAPGTYHVRAQAQGYGPVIVPVVIRAGQTTFVYLDGNTLPERSLRQAKGAPRLRTGQILGWPATNETSNPKLQTSEKPQ